MRPLLRQSWAFHVTNLAQVTPALARELSRSEQLWSWQVSRLHKVSFPKSRRTVFAMGMYQVAADHQASIALLVKAGRIGSALALVRSCCEAVVMGMWIMHRAPDDQLEAMGRDEYSPPALDKLVKQLDKAGLFDRPMFEDIEDAIERMHGFTHGGLQHIAARYMGDRVGANYAERDAIWALRTADLFAVLAALEVAQVTGDEALAESMYHEARAMLGFDGSGTEAL
jgi:hypothetical protein